MPLRKALFDVRSRRPWKSENTFMMPSYLFDDLAGTKFFENFSFLQNSPLFSGCQYFLLRNSTTFWILMIWCDLLFFPLVYFRIPSLFWVCWNFTIMCLGSIGLSLYTGPLCSENSYPSVLATFLLRLLMQFPLLDFLHPFFWR